LLLFTDSGEQSSGNLQHDVNIVGQNDVEGSGSSNP